MYVCVYGEKGQIFSANIFTRLGWELVSHTNKQNKWDLVYKSDSSPLFSTLSWEISVVYGVFLWERIVEVCLAVGKVHVCCSHFSKSYQSVVLMFYPRVVWKLLQSHLCRQKHKLMPEVRCIFFFSVSKLLLPFVTQTFFFLSVPRFHPGAISSLISETSAQESEANMSGLADLSLLVIWVRKPWTFCFNHMHLPDGKYHCWALSVAENSQAGSFQGD